MISIGVVVGGPPSAGSPFDREVMRAMNYFSSLPMKGADSSTVNVVFHLPGRYGKPDFKGCRTGKFSAQEPKLMVQVAVPGRALSSASARDMLAAMLYQSVEVAASFFEEHGVAYDARSDQQLVFEYSGVEPGELGNIHEPERVSFLRTMTRLFGRRS